MSYKVPQDLSFYDRVWDSVLKRMHAGEAIIRIDCETRGEATKLRYLFNAARTRSGRGELASIQIGLEDTHIVFKPHLSQKALSQLLDMVQPPETAPSSAQDEIANLYGRKE